MVATKSALRSFVEGSRQPAAGLRGDGVGLWGQGQCVRVQRKHLCLYIDASLQSLLRLARVMVELGGTAITVKALTFEAARTRQRLDEGPLRSAYRGRIEVL